MKPLILIILSFFLLGSKSTRPKPIYETRGIYLASINLDSFEKYIKYSRRKEYSGIVYLMKVNELFPIREGLKVQILDIKEDNKVRAKVLGHPEITVSFWTFGDELRAIVEKSN